MRRVGQEIDLETCSRCTAEVPDRTLREVPGGEGARLCQDCVFDFYVQQKQQKAQQKRQKRVSA